MLGLVFTSGLAVVPLLMAAVAIPTMYLLVRGVTGVTDVSFIVQYPVVLIGPGIAIDGSGIRHGPMPGSRSLLARS